MFLLVGKRLRRNSRGHLAPLNTNPSGPEKTVGPVTGIRQVSQKAVTPMAPLRVIDRDPVADQGVVLLSQREVGLIMTSMVHQVHTQEEAVIEPLHIQTVPHHTRGGLE